MELKDVKCFILDMDGTIYLGSQLFSYTKEFLDTVKACGLDYWYYTNNSSKNAALYVKKLENMGISVEPHKMLISNQVIIEYIKKNHPGAKVYVVGTKYLVDDFTASGIELSDRDADIVVVGFDITLTYEKLIKACDFVRYGALFYGVNMDYNCPTETGFIPDCGSICQLIYASTKVKPEFFGKPSEHTARFILEKSGYEKKDLAIIGDRIYTDIALGAYNGFTSIMVLSGESKQKDIETSDAKPTLVYESLKEITKDLKKIYGIR